jgi:hypothetical protein
MYQKLSFGSQPTEKKVKQFLIVVQLIMRFSSVPWKTIGVQMATNVKYEFENFQVQS